MGASGLERGRGGRNGVGMAVEEVGGESLGIETKSGGVSEETGGIAGGGGRSSIFHRC